MVNFVAAGYGWEAESQKSRSTRVVFHHTGRFITLGPGLVSTSNVLQWPRLSTRAPAEGGVGMECAPLTSLPSWHAPYLSPK